MNRKHGLLLFLCALVPGCGQMYQGYMKRGISLTFGFSAILAVAEIGRASCRERV